MQEVFRAGVAPGGPSSQFEIKTLVLYTLSETGQTMSFSQLYDALSEEHLVNYFELVQAAEQLDALGHLRRAAQADGADAYSATDQGAQAARELVGTLPLSVREKALRGAQKALARERRVKEAVVDVQPAAGGGFQLRLEIPDADGPLVSFTLYAPNEEQCALIRRRFLNAPGYIYKGVLALLTGNREVLDEVFPPPKEQLF